MADDNQSVPPEENSVADNQMEQASKMGDNARSVPTSSPSDQPVQQEENFASDAEVVKGDTIQEQAQDIQQKAMKANATISTVSNVAASFINPVTGIIALFLVVVSIIALLAIAGSETLGRNPNACKNGEDCSVAEAIAGGKCDDVTANISGEGNIEKAYNYMVSNGFSSAGAAGIAGNFQAESGAVPWIAEYSKPNPPPGWVTGLYSRPGGIEDRVGGWGIGQWSFGRHAALKNYIINGIGKQYYVSQYTNGNPPMDRTEEDTLLAAQLDFMLDGEPAERANILAVKNATTPEAAARLFHDKWERSAGWDEKRAVFARQIYDKLNGSSDGTVTINDCSGGSALSGDIVELATQIAWPDGRKVNCCGGYGQSVSTPEYIQAKSKAMGISPDPLASLYSSCDRFVATVIKLTVDPGIPWGSSTTQYNYLGSSSKWTKRTGALQAGDVLTTPGHILIYLGNGRVAQASYLSYTATAGNEPWGASPSGSYRVPWDSRTYKAYYFSG